MSSGVALRVDAWRWSSGAKQDRPNMSKIMRQVICDVYHAQRHDVLPDGDMSVHLQCVADLLSGIRQAASTECSFLQHSMQHA